MWSKAALAATIAALALAGGSAHAQTRSQLPGAESLGTDVLAGLPGAAAAAAEQGSKGKPESYDAGQFNRAVAVRNGSQRNVATPPPVKGSGGLSDPLAAITPVTIPYQDEGPVAEPDLGIRFPDRLRPQVLAPRGDNAFSVALEARGVACRLDASPSHGRLGATQARINAHVASTLSRGEARTWMEIPGRTFSAGGRVGALYWPDPAKSRYAAYSTETPRTRVFMVCQVSAAADRSAMASIIRDVRIP